MQLKLNSTKRGDTIIEAMFAFAIFTMVAIVSIMIMNAGIAASERSLELVTARNELNAQAEALRFIHSSYIAEKNLLSCNQVEGERCRQYDALWGAITNNARLARDSSAPSQDTYSIPDPLDSCQEVYTDRNGQGSLLEQNYAFIINTRALYADAGSGQANAIVSANSLSGRDVFTAPLLGARLLYGNSTLTNTDIENSGEKFSELVKYTDLLRAEGIWVVAVKGYNNAGSNTTPQYYDFYINTCWYGAGNSVPTTLDTVVRLYNPDGA